MAFPPKKRVCLSLAYISIDARHFGAVYIIFVVENWVVSQKIAGSAEIGEFDLLVAHVGVMKRPGRRRRLGMILVITRFRGLFGRKIFGQMSRTGQEEHDTRAFNDLTVV